MHLLFAVAAMACWAAALGIRAASGAPPRPGLARLLFAAMLALAGLWLGGLWRKRQAAWAEWCFFLGFLLSTLLLPDEKVASK
mmetsp:Transcript_94452/g.266810  ORF Transcript_94452/g.266810 Transcript_94452/m.266810 type:complete len:83 (-) Transcript_94452:16-264(-)